MDIPYSKVVSKRSLLVALLASFFIVSSITVFATTANPPPPGSCTATITFYPDFGNYPFLTTTITDVTHGKTFSYGQSETLVATCSGSQRTITISLTAPKYTNPPTYYCGEGTNQCWYVSGAISSLSSPNCVGQNPCSTTANVLLKSTGNSGTIKTSY